MVSLQGSQDLFLNLLEKKHCYFAAWSWNNLQGTLKLNAFVSLERFRAIKVSVTEECNYYAEDVTFDFIICFFF